MLGVPSRLLVRPRVQRLPGDALSGGLLLPTRYDVCDAVPVSQRNIQRHNRSSGVRPVHGLHTWQVLQRVCIDSCLGQLRCWVCVHSRSLHCVPDGQQHWLQMLARGVLPNRQRHKSLLSRRVRADTAYIAFALHYHFAFLLLPQWCYGHRWLVFDVC
jgi:hypothetical protein